jgi:hypothetical protein
MRGWKMIFLATGIHKGTGATPISEKAGFEPNLVRRV